MSTTNPHFHDYSAPHLIIDGADLKIDGITQPIRQQIVFAGFSYMRDISSITKRPNGPFGGFPGQAEQGSTLTVFLQVLFFHKNADGSYGERVGGVVPEYQHTLIANSTTLVDNATGEYLGVVGDELKPESYFEGGPLYGREFIRENQFFDRIAKELDVNVMTLLERYIRVNNARIQPSQGPRF